jgi:hypothetical protein
MMDESITSRDGCFLRCMLTDLRRGKLLVGIIGPCALFDGGETLNE